MLAAIKAEQNPSQALRHSNLQVWHQVVSISLEGITGICRAESATHCLLLTECLPVNIYFITDISCEASSENSAGG